MTNVSRVSFALDKNCYILLSLDCLVAIPVSRPEWQRGEYNVASILRIPQQVFPMPNSLWLRWLPFCDGRKISGIIFEGFPSFPCSGLSPTLFLVFWEAYVPSHECISPQPSVYNALMKKYDMSASKVFCARIYTVQND